MRISGGFIGVLMRIFLAGGLVLLLCALGIAVWKLQALEAQDRQLEAQVKALREETEHPTTFIGAFPDNMPEIIRMANATVSKLVIVNDYCAYGHYSDPQEYQDYKAALIGLAKTNREVQLFVYSPAEVERATSSQFGTNFDQIKNDARFEKYFNFYHGDSTRPRPKSLSEFNRLLENEQDRCVTELSQQGVHVYRSIDVELPLFMWLRDQEEGIVSMYNLGEAQREVSLLTKNRHLLTVLDDIAVRAEHEARPSVDKQGQ